MNSDPKLEDLISQLGGFGKYQLFQYILHSLACFTAGVHMLSLTFVAKTPKFRCFIDEIDYEYNVAPSFELEKLEKYIPMSLNGELDTCQRFKAIDSRFGIYSNVSEKCDQFVYDRSTFLQSRVYEWDMVCDEKWKRAFIQSVYVFGVVCGALLCGTLADRFGRKTILCISAIFQCFFGIIGPFFAHYTLYCITLYFYGMFGSAGALVTGFVLTAELLPKKAKLYCGIIFGSFFSLGVCFVALWAYLIRNILILQIVLALHSVILFGHWWLMDESIRWLWSKNRVEEAVALVRKGAEINGNYFIDKEIYYKMDHIVENEDQSKKVYGLSDLFKTPTIRLRSLIISLIWFSTSMTYYGVAFNTGYLTGDPFVIFFLVSAVDLIGDVILLFIVNRVGRRSLNICYLSIQSISFFIMAFLPRGMTLTIISLLAKIACASCFRLIYNYTGELFPTVIRNSALGFGSFAARIAGMLTPQILLLASINQSYPPLIIGTITLIAVLLSLLLPETLNQDLPQTLEDGEMYGLNDNALICFKVKWTPSPRQGPPTLYAHDLKVMRNMEEIEIETTTNGEIKSPEKKCS